MRIQVLSLFLTFHLSLPAIASEGEFVCNLIPQTPAFSKVPNPGLGSRITKGSKDKLHFDRLLRHVRKRYQYLLAKKPIRWDIDWDSKVVNSFATIDENGHRSIRVFGELYRTPDLSADGFLGILCHELGHHFAGAPMHALQPLISAEGQADYYSTQVCLPLMFEGLDNQAILKKLNVPLKIRLRCDHLWVTPERSAICQRSLMAAENLAKVLDRLGDGGDGSGISLLIRDPEFAEETLLDAYPMAQCRLDTFKAGALCKKTASSTQHPGVSNNCGFHQMLQSQGARPRCWFKYGASD